MFVDERKQIKIYVTGEAKDAVVSFAETFDMTETGVASRVYEWFGKQPLAVRKWITGLTDGNEASALNDFVRQFPAGTARSQTSGRVLKRAAKPMPGKK